MLDMVLRTADMEHLSFRDTVDCEGDNLIQVILFTALILHTEFSSDGEVEI